MMSVFKRKGEKFFIVKIKIGSDWKQFRTKEVLKSEAKKIQRELELKYQNYSDSQIASSVLTVIDVLKWFQVLTKPFKKEITIHNNLRDIKTFEKFFKDTLVENLNAKKVQEYIEYRLSNNVKITTISTELAFAKASFRRAYFESKIDLNPFDRIKTPMVVNKREKFLTPKEQKVFIDHLPKSMRDIFFLAFNTGLRRKNLVELRWDQINFEQSTINIEKDDMKTKALSIPISDAVLRVLKRIRDSDKVNLKYVFPSPTKKRKSELPCYHIMHLTKVARETAKKLGLKGVVFHTARHSFCSNLAIGGASPFDIKELSGHTSLANVERYTHLNNERKRKVLKLLKTGTID